MSGKKLPKEVKLQVRVSSAEDEQITKAADGMKLSKSAYMRCIIVKDAEKRNYLSELAAERQKKVGC